MEQSDVYNQLLVIHMGWYHSCKNLFDVINIKIPIFVGMVVTYANLTDFASQFFWKKKQNKRKKTRESNDQKETINNGSSNDGYKSDVSFQNLSDSEGKTKKKKGKKNPWKMFPPNLIPPKKKKQIPIHIWLHVQIELLKFSRTWFNLVWQSL